MTIPQQILEQIIAQARGDAPMETCGYLAGRDGHVTQCYPVRNDDQAEEHFTLNPEEQLSAAANAEQEGLDIIALYHSHPIGLAWPSAEDVRLAFDPSLLYVIISLIGKKEDVRAFRIRGGEIEEERIVVCNV